MSQGARLSLRSPIATSSGAPSPEFQRAFNALSAKVDAVEADLAAAEAQRVTDYAHMQTFTAAAVAWLTFLDLHATAHFSGPFPTSLPNH